MRQKTVSKIKKFLMQMRTIQKKSSNYNHIYVCISSYNSVIGNKIFTGVAPHFWGCLCLDSLKCTSMFNKYA